jgi:predicted  nucleic acid-binding Zn-ribbon protein
MTNKEFKAQELLKKLVETANEYQKLSQEIRELKKTTHSMSSTTNEYMADKIVENVSNWQRDQQLMTRSFQGYVLANEEPVNEYITKMTFVKSEFHANKAAVIDKPWKI